MERTLMIFFSNVITGAVVIALALLGIGTIGYLWSLYRGRTYTVAECFLDGIIITLILMLAIGASYAIGSRILS